MQSYRIKRYNLQRIFKTNINRQMLYYQINDITKPQSWALTAALFP